MLPKECSSKLLNKGFSESPQTFEFPIALPLHVLQYLTPDCACPLPCFCSLCSCWLQSSCLAPTWTTIFTCCYLPSWSCSMPLKSHCHLGSKHLLFGTNSQQSCSILLKMSCFKIPSPSFFVVVATPIILVQKCFRFMEILTVPIPLKYMLDPCHPKYLRSHPSPFGTDC